MECGTALPEGAKFCFSCGSKISVMNLQNIRKETQVTEEGQSEELVSLPCKIDGVSLKFSRSIYDNIKYRVPFIRNGLDSKRKLVHYSFANVKKFDDLFSLEIPECLDYIEASVRIAIDELIKLNIFEFDIDSFVEQFGIANGFISDIEKVVQKYDEISAYADELNYKRNVQRATRSKWQGGGFGLGGAIKGALTAGMLNAGTSVFRGIGDSITDSRDASKIQEIKRNAFIANNYQMLIANAVFYANERIGFAFCTILQREGILSEVIPLVDNYTLRTKLDNLEKKYQEKALSKSEARNIVIEWIEKNPFSIYYCDFLYRVLEVENVDVANLCQHLGYDREYEQMKIDYVKKGIERLEAMPEKEITIKEIEHLKRMSENCEVSQVEKNRLGELEYKKHNYEKTETAIEEGIQKNSYNEARIRDLIHNNKIDDVWCILNEEEENAYAQWELTRFYSDLVEGDVNRSNFDGIEAKLKKVYHMMEHQSTFASYLVNDIKRKCYVRNKNSSKVIRADEKIEQLAKDGQISACALVGFLYYKGDDYFKKNYDKAFKYLKCAADKNHPMAMAWLGTCYLEGLGTEKDIYEAKKWFEIAAYYGHKHAQDELKKLL